jgi:hypothetical protein
MKGTEQLLSEMFALARRAPAPLPAGLPFGMETAVLAHWKSSWSSSKIDGGMLRVFRWAALLACLMAIAGGTWKSEDITQISQGFDPETRIVDSALLAGLDR